MAKPRAKKSGSPAPRAASPKPDEGPKANGREVGSQVKLSKDDAETIADVRARIIGVEQQLGSKRAEYMSFEAEAMSALTKLNEEYKNLVMTQARKRKLDKKDEAWRFEPSEMAFTRTA